MSSPFDLDNDEAYQAWRSAKLAAYAPSADRLRVEVAQIARPTRAEIAAIGMRVETANMALICTQATQIEPQALLAFGKALGLERTDTNMFADDRAVSRITPTATDDAALAPHPERGDYIPYTTRPLSWHTDGYYNQPDRQVRAWTLFCAAPARIGGINSLLDHEIAYIHLRDLCADHIEALSHPETLRIPANAQHGEIRRPASLGPVFSVRQGYLHMRYTARARHAVWRDDAATKAARTALDRLFSSRNAFTFTHRLESGEGIVSNNVLHNRSGFEAEEDVRHTRLLYRVRYLDRIRRVAN